MPTLSQTLAQLNTVSPGFATSPLALVAAQLPGSYQDEYLQLLGEYVAATYQKGGGLSADVANTARPDLEQLAAQMDSNNNRPYSPFSHQLSQVASAYPPATIQVIGRLAAFLRAHGF